MVLDEAISVGIHYTECGYKRELGGVVPASTVHLRFKNISSEGEV